MFSYVHRAHAINNIIRTQTEQETFEQFITDIYSPPTSRSNRPDSDTITLKLSQKYEQHCSIGNYMKLNNDSLSNCYANSCLQCFFSLGLPFFQQVRFFTDLSLFFYIYRTKIEWTNNRIGHVRLTRRLFRFNADYNRFINRIFGRVF